MFNNYTSADKPTAATTIITKGIVLKGNLTSQENIRLDGKISGEIYCKQRLVIGVEGCAEGSIETQDADISGTIQGDITVFGHLNIQNTAKILGNIQAKQIQVSEGAILEGECRVGNIKNKSTKIPITTTVEQKIVAAPLINNNNKVGKSSNITKQRVERPQQAIATMTKPKVVAAKKVVTPSSKVKATPVVAAAAITHTSVFPEGEFIASTVKNIDKNIAKQKAVVASSNKVKVVQKERPTPQFNATKFAKPTPVVVNTPVAVKKEEVVEKATAPRRMGIRLPTITMKW